MTKSEFYRRVDAFFAEFDGKAADFDHAYGNQCKDVFSYYNHDVVGNDTYIYGNGVDLWTNAPDSLYERIPNTATSVPQKGDIPIWNAKVGGGAGHVDIATGKGDTNTFIGFDENWPIGSLCHFQEHNYNNVIGYLRPRNTNDEEPKPAPAPQADPRDARIDELSTRVTNLEAQSGDLTTRLAKSQNDLNAANIEITDLMTTHAGNLTDMQTSIDQLTEEKKNLMIKISADARATAMGYKIIDLLSGIKKTVAKALSKVGIKLS